MTTKTVPLTARGQVVGEAKLNDDGTVTARITDEKLAQELMGDFYSISIRTDPIQAVDVKWDVVE